MAPKFGTSGLRGLVTELTDGLVAAHVTAFARVCDCGGRLMLGRDLRASSPRIADAVAQATRRAGLAVEDCGALPTPALAFAAARAGAGAVMVTGSHIPDDRNGLKFYTRGGAEITKADEAAIIAALSEGAESSLTRGFGTITEGAARARDAWRDRWLGAFAPGALAGLRVGLYEHSSVGRDLLAHVLAALGAEVVRLGRSAQFVPVDTEAVPDTLRRQLADWAAAHRLDAIVSTDGDADRPLLTDAAGRVVPGDVLGLVTARFLGADTVVTPVSSTSALELSGAFARVHRTRIGSPYVIAGIATAQAADPGARVAGFEANGGFMAGFEATLPGGGCLAPLLTRDAMLPILATLCTARAQRNIEPKQAVSTLLAALPARATMADRLQGIDPAQVADLLTHIARDRAARASLLGGGEVALDLTDGLRVSRADGTIVHLRPSGNAPELRCYAEAATGAEAARLVNDTLARVAVRLAVG